jgi:hypothetical protein
LEIVTNNNPGSITGTQMKALKAMLGMLGIVVEKGLFCNMSFDEAVTFIKAIRDRAVDKNN